MSGHDDRWRGTITRLNTPTKSGKTIPEHLFTWDALDLPIIDQRETVGWVTRIDVVPGGKVFACGYLESGHLIGHLRKKGHLLYVCPNIRKETTPGSSTQRWSMYAITIMGSPSWDDAYIQLI